MIVYGGRERLADPRELIGALIGAERRAAALPAGLDRHGALAGCLIAGGQIAQGLADAAFGASGSDERSAVSDALGSVQMAQARALLASLGSGFAIGATNAIDALGGLLALALPEAVRLRTPEGFAWYAVYPEAFALAARRRAWETAPIVIGLRSIGPTLAAMVAAGSGAPAPISLRPTGEAFDRRPRLGAALRCWLQAQRTRSFAIVDEGPGLSGSSLLGAAEALLGIGAATDRITLVPSHRGEPGPMAGPPRRALWRSLRRQPATFDDLAADAPGLRIETWFEDLTGPPTAPLEDLSGGAWRAALDAPNLPADPARERRKFRLTTEQGRFRLRFAGLGDLGETRFARARALARAGFAPMPLAFRHGLVLEPWLEGARPLDRWRGPPPRLAAYIAWRARAFPANNADGASAAELLAMARANIAEGVSPALARSLTDRPPVEPTRRSRSDSRLHAFEWLATADGRLVKTDLDHDDGHDLTGCQDAAWDVAGAEVEFSLTGGQARGLCEAVAQALGEPVAAERLALARLCYPAFQLGLWTLARDQAAPEDRPPIEALMARYRAAVIACPG